MPRSRRSKAFVRRFADERVSGRQPDLLVVEEPLTIQVDGTTVATTMRTPGHDFELAVGFCVGEGLLVGAHVRACRYCAGGSGPDGAATADRASATEFNVVSVDTDGGGPVPQARLGLVSSACGLCGTNQIDELAERLAPLGEAPPFDPAVLAGAPDLVRARQTLFDETGAAHAAALIGADGEVDLVREDIGRHNAVDKVVGRLQLDGRLPASDLGLFVSGRASFEMVLKAWAAGFSAMVAVSAPSALAVDAAARAGLTLAGFARDGALTLYTGLDR
ncbi:MAG: sulfurtransferase FdhD [Actinomycetia bacterium]|nr:sulfurtransferase FdhD [Actinomycetes bacterium]